ncbi:MAG: hypothetical protein AB7V19_01165 [Candidatus Bipolaricaulia bacterium]
MSDWDKASGWVRMLISYAIWFVILLVARQVVLSLRGVVQLGFAISPSMWSSSMYPEGLFWVQVFDMAFRTVLILTSLAFGGKLRDGLSSAAPWGKHLGRIAYYGLGVGALTIGYFAYRPLILPLLQSQGAGWAYSLIFWVIAAGILALASFEFVRFLSAGAAAESTIPRHGGGPLADAKDPRPRARSARPEEPVDQALPRVRDAAVGAGSPAELPAGEPQPESERRDRVINLVRPAFAGATAKSQLPHFLQICDERKPYKMVVAAFVTPPPDVRRIRFVGIPADRPLEATALEVLTQEELASWEKTTLEGIVILNERDM